MSRVLNGSSHNREEDLIAERISARPFASVDYHRSAKTPAELFASSSVGIKVVSSSIPARGQQVAHPASRRPHAQRHLYHPSQFFTACAACRLDRHAIDDRGDVAGEIGGGGMDRQVTLCDRALEALA